ncbi:hypothetical protein PSEEN1733 [Pseudomonas entomophila L48]|uniref:Uncharacterized protein n=1 Tax=Pseudomonas entomophila (strain L48) TaxID=384676 RepID=Q1ICN3_PSEE4|nr:hypothetical protein PSEEN1733 [Pseudomonas entomophila L48]
MQTYASGQSPRQGRTSRISTPLYRTTYSNGTPFLDGNPISSAKDIIKKRTLRVIIEGCTHDFSTYTESCGHGTETVLTDGIDDLEKIKNHINTWCSQ